MTPIELTRQQRRALQREADEIDSVTDADRRFFERFPDRTFRVRTMARAEIASLEIATGGPLIPLGPGEAAFTVVKNVTAGVRFRIHVPGPADEAGSEGSEAIGAWLWARHERHFPSFREREAAFRKAMAQARDPDSKNGGAT